MDRASREDWVEISDVIFEPGRRARGLPSETAAVSYEMRVRGFALEEGACGERISIRTLAGRRLSGRLEQVRPAFRPDYGDLMPELMEIKEEMARITRRSRR